MKIEIDIKEFTDSFIKKLDDTFADCRDGNYERKTIILTLADVFYAKLKTPAAAVGLEALPATWRAKALDLRLMHLYPQAQLCEMHASELETVLSAQDKKND